MQLGKMITTKKLFMIPNKYKIIYIFKRVHLLLIIFRTLLYVNRYMTAIKGYAINNKNPYKDYFSRIKMELSH